jgi:hypothetical protein
LSDSGLRNDLSFFQLDRIEVEWPMPKELIARHDLERIVMQEIRAFPGCEHVSDVAVEYQRDKVHRTNWVMQVFTSEGANMERVQYAINATQHKLRQRYDIRELS